MESDLAECEHKELREEIFAQVACHISVTFTSQNNSRLSLTPASASSLCLSHALCVDTEGNLLQNIVDKASWAKTVYVCVCGGGKEVNVSSISFVWMGCLFGNGKED